MGDRESKDQLFEVFAEVGKALSSARRVEIVDLLAQGERSVEQISLQIDQSIANTSNHLRALAKHGLVETRREGNSIYYRLAGDPVERLWAAMRDVAKQCADDLDSVATAYLGDRRTIEIVSRKEARGLIRAGNVSVLDVRPFDEYRAGHLPGAISVPPDNLSRALRNVPQHDEVVAYCRGEYCVFADKAVRSLQRKGIRARRLEDGFPEWRLSGLPVVTGDEPGRVA